MPSDLRLSLILVFFHGFKPGFPLLSYLKDPKEELSSGQLFCGPSLCIVLDLGLIFIVLVDLVLFVKVSSSLVKILTLTRAR